MLGICQYTKNDINNYDAKRKCILCSVPLSVEVRPIQRPMVSGTNRLEFNGIFTPIIQAAAENE